MQVLFAENGRDGLEVLEQHPVDVVLMDMMMPEMDGYEAMRASARTEKFQDLPIIALTAKAMKGRPREVHPGRRVGLHRQAD